MKIALVAPTHLPARRANTLQVMKMAQAFTCLGHSVQVCVPGRPPAPVTWEEMAHLYGLRQRFPVTWLPALPALRRYDYGLRAVGWARGWRSDLLYTRLPQAAAIASVLGMASILESHDFPPAGIGVWLFRGFLKGRGARRLVAITHSLANDLRGKLGAPEAPFTVVAPDGVDLERYAGLPDAPEARGELGMAPGGFTAGYTGHLYAGRGVELILELAKRLPQVSFLLAGGEPGEVQRVEETVRSAGLENVMLVGFQPNAVLPRYHAACDLFLMPYQRRVAASSGGDIARYLSPMKLFEYMACGRPILCSDLPVLREVLTPEKAILLPPDDVEAWVAAIQALQADSGRRAMIGEALRQEASRYTWEGRAENILKEVF
jgi:glycosyltransferase involved in cell wall biosynthesis